MQNIKNDKMFELEIGYLKKFVDFLSFAKNMCKNIGKSISKNLSGKYFPGMLAMLQRLLDHGK